MKPTPLVLVGLLLVVVLGGFVSHAVGGRARLTAVPSRHFPSAAPATSEAGVLVHEITPPPRAPVAATTPSLEEPITAAEIAEVLADPDFVARLPAIDGGAAALADATTSGTVMSDGAVLPASGGIVVAADGKVVAAGSSGVSVTEDGRIIPLPAGGYTVARDGTITPRPAAIERNIH